jgi:hypothetical protein
MRNAPPQEILVELSLRFAERSIEIRVKVDPTVPEEVCKEKLSVQSRIIDAFALEILSGGTDDLEDSPGFLIGGDGRYRSNRTLSLRSGTPSERSCYDATLRVPRKLHSRGPA